eukprot:EG_transcript_25159
MLDVSMLSAFSGEELQRLFCGDSLVSWDEARLADLLQPCEALAAEGQTMQWLAEILVAMTAAERARFLEFVTAVPRLTPHARIQVRRSLGPSPVPSSQTCISQLNVPAYRDREALRQALLEAMAHTAEFHEAPAAH